MINIFHKAYCLFCKTGSENLAAQHMNDLNEGIKAISPVRIMQERYKRQWIERERLLIPGYIFLYVKEDIFSNNLVKSSRAYKILEYQTGQKELVGSDFEYARWIYDNDGRIKPSRVLLEGDDIKVIDGPLKENIGRIYKLDRHKRRAWVLFDFHGREHRVSLSVLDIAIIE